MEKQIAANNFKTWLLFAVLLVIFLAAGSLTYLFTGDYVWSWLTLIIGVAYIAWTYSSASKQILKLSHATPANRKAHRRLYLSVQNMSIALGIKMPKVYIINDPALNAFAAGFNVDNSVIGVTSGLLEHLKRQELEGVLAHELGHIVNRDIRVSTMAFALLAGLGIILEMNIRSAVFGRGRRDNNLAGIAIVIVVSILLVALAFLAKMAISRRREYLADVTGAQITRYPLGLAAALEKISQHGSELKAANASTAHFFLNNPLKKGAFLSNLLSTHPPIEDRIARLRRMEGEGY